MLKLGASANEVLALNVKLGGLGRPETSDAPGSVSKEESRRLQGISDMQILQTENNLYLHKQALIDSSVAELLQRLLILMAPGWRAPGRDIVHFFANDSEGVI